MYDNVCGYNILPNFVNQLIASSIQIIQIDSRHLLSYFMPISLVYYYTGIFCDIWKLLFTYAIVLLSFIIISPINETRMVGYWSQQAGGQFVVGSLCLKLLSQFSTHLNETSCTWSKRQVDVYDIFVRPSPGVVEFGSYSDILI